MADETITKICCGEHYLVKFTNIFKKDVLQLVF